MQFRFFLFLALLLAMVAGCKDAVTDASALSPTVETLEASSAGPSSVRLHWPPTSDAAYHIHWEAVTDRLDSGSTMVPTNEVVIGSLISGRVYRFTMTPLRGGSFAEPITGGARSIEWAPAARYDGSGRADSGIRLYEPGSDSSGGLLLDPQLGGPIRIGTAGGALAAQLAIWTSSSSSNVFNIGPAFAFPSYRNNSSFMVDSTVAISVTTQLATSLDTWYCSRPVSALIDPDGTHKAYSLAASQPDSLGQGFFVRVGSPGAYHYARVLIRNVGGKLLQGVPPNRYVELDISYQTTPDVPYARAVPRSDAPAGVPAVYP